MTITTFAKLDGSETYTFPTSPGNQDFRTNFKNLLTKASRIPGGNGGVDEYGIGRSASPVGNIQFSTYLISSTRAGMQTLRDALNEIADWGVGILTDNLNGTDRWSLCRVSDITMSEERQANTDLWQKVQLSFQAAEPFWMTVGNQNVWDGTYTFNSAITWDGSTGFNTINGSGSFTLTNNGNAYTVARLAVRVTGATAFNQLMAQRLVNGGVTDQWVYTGAIVQNDILEVSPRNQWVLLNGADKIANFEFNHPDWMRLLPGSNTINIVLDDAAATVQVKGLYYERYT